MRGISETRFPQACLVLFMPFLIAGTHVSGIERYLCFRNRHQVVAGQGRNRTTDTWIFKRPRLPRSNPSAAHSSRQRSVPWSAYLPGFTNLSVIRSDSPIARYLSRSLSPSPSVGGRVHTPSG